MSDYTTHLPANPGTDYPTKMAALLDALTLDTDKIDVAQLGYQFGARRNAHSGLDYAYYGGVIEIDGVTTTIANGTVTLSNAATNYVERTAAGVVSKNTVGFSADKIPMAEVTTAGGAITLITDRRATGRALVGMLSKSVAGGAGTTTLTEAESRPPILTFTGVLTGNRVIELPNLKRAWVVENATTGAFSLTVKVTGQPGTAVTQGKRKIVYGNGTDIVSAMDDFPAAPVVSEVITGTMIDWPSTVIPAGYLERNGQNVSRATYAALFAVLVKTAVVTFDSGTDKVAWNAHGLSNGDVFKFSTTGGAPTGLVAGTTYYVRDVAANDFAIAATEGGAAINFTTNGTGVHTGIHAPFGDGDGATTFTLPDDRRRVTVGRGGSATSTLGARLGATGGEEAHVQTSGELATHNHAGMSATLAGGAGPASRVDGGGQTTNNAGSSTAMNVMQPSTVVVKLIKT
jgi:hypothetical protein